MTKYFIKFILSSQAIHILLLIIYFFKKFQFVHFRTDRIGHLSLNTEVFLRKIQLHEYPNEILYILFPSPFISNRKLYNMYKSFFNQKKNIILIENTMLIKIISFLYQSKRKYILEIEMNSNEYNLFINTKPSLSFSKDDEIMGKDLLNQLGINTWYICIFARDNAYLNNIMDQDVDLSYHNFRDCDIDTFDLASQYIIDKGGSVIRMGSMTNKPISFKHPRIIDYPYSEYRNEFLDIYLISKCKFVLASTSGATDVCAIFGIPRAGVNWIPLDHLPWTNKFDIGIVKKLKYNNKYIGLTKYFDLIKQNNIIPFDGNSYKSFGIEIEDNTAEEILNICIEMYTSLESELMLTQEDIENQKLYQSVHQKSPQFHQVLTPLSYKFLKNNPWILT